MKTAFYKQQVATGTLISAPAVYTGTDGQTYIVFKVGPVMPRSIALRAASQHCFALSTLSCLWPLYCRCHLSCIQ